LEKGKSVGKRLAKSFNQASDTEGSLQNTANSYLVPTQHSMMHCTLLSPPKKENKTKQKLPQNVCFQRTKAINRAGRQIQ